MNRRPTELGGGSEIFGRPQDLDLDRAISAYWRKRRIKEREIYGEPTKVVRPKVAQRRSASG